MGEVKVVDPDLDKGYQLVRTLDEHGLRPSAALWLLEDGVWRLMLQIPALENSSIHDRYQSIQKVIKSSPRVLPQLTEITIADEDSELLRVLRQSFSQGFRGSDIRTHLTRTYILGVFIEEAYIYRI